nr:patatin-like phospholipase family protein [bacterium]
MRYSNFILVVILIFISLSPAAAIENAGTIENAQATSNAYKFENAPATSNAYEIENAQEIANDGEIEKTEAVKSAPDSKNTLIKPKLKIGLVLSGGGSRGFAHIGVLKRLHKHNIIPDIISGCSMGAFIGAMYASGYSPEEIENIVLTSDWDALFSDKPLRSNIIITDREYADNNYLFSFDFRWNKMLWKKAVNDGNFLENMLASKLGIYSAAASNDFNELAIPLRISATDFITGNPEYFDSGNLPELVRASMSYPGLFAPKQYQSKYLIDGFIASNIPIDVLKKEKCDYIIISDVTSDLLPIEKINSILDVIDQTLQISIQPKIYEDLKKANLVISPDVKKISTTDFNNIEAIIKKGEEAITDETISVILSATGDSKKSTLEIKPENYYAISKINHLNLKKLDKSVVKDYTDRLLGKNYDSRNMISTIYNLYGSGHFDKISYNFNKNISDTNLTLNLVLMEKNYNSINLGVYADEYYKAAGCLGFSKNNIDKFGSKLDLETNFGLYKKIRLKYTTQNTTSFKLISQISANYNESFLKLFAGKKFLGKDNYRYKDIVLSVNKYINFHSTFNTAIYFSDYNDEL